MIRVAVVGYGYWGPNLVRNFAEIPEAELAACCERRPERLSAFRRRYPGIRAVSDYSEVLRDPDIDAVILATQITTHHRLARQALIAGKHILVEKPLCRRVREAKELIRLAGRSGLVLMVGHTFIYNVAVRKLRELIRRRVLGEVYYVDSTRANLGLFQEPLNVLWDLAAHDISILDYILEATPGRVTAVGSSCIQKGIEDIAYVTLRYPRGVLAHLHVSWLDPCKIRRITVVGSRRMVVYDDLEPLEKLKIYDKGVELPSAHESYGEFELSYRYGDVVIPRLEQVEPLKAECRHFLDCIKRRKEPEFDAGQGLEVVRVLEACERSLRRGTVSVRI